MANTKISEFAAVTTLAGNELLAGVQSGGNAYATPDQIRTYINSAGFLSKMRFFNSYTSEALYEGIAIDFSGNVGRIYTETVGGAVRPMLISAGHASSPGQIYFSTARATVGYELAFCDATALGATKAVLYAAGTNVLRLTGTTGTVGAAFRLREVTSTPTTPPAEHCNLYAKDNGAGKTQFVIQMPDGVETVLATET